jgi:hypothetical protein
LLGLCKVEIPGQVKVQGTDFSDYFRGGADPSGGRALIGCPAPFGQWTRRQGGREYRGIRTTRHTYARDLSGSWLLFDNLADPYQRTNLLGSPAMIEIRRSLELSLQIELKDSQDDFLSAPELIARWGYQVDENGTVPYTP